MSADEKIKCTRCGTPVTKILSGPPDHRNVWWRFRAGVTCTLRTNTFRMKIFRREWLPEDPHDRVRETYTTLDLCDACTSQVFQFAQGLL